MERLVIGARLGISEGAIFRAEGWLIGPSDEIALSSYGDRQSSFSILAHMRAILAGWEIGIPDAITS